MITGDTPLRQVNINQAAAYFQDPAHHHNHPMVYYASGLIMVVTRNRTLIFPLEKIEEAFACFKAQLEELAYFE